MYVIVPGFFDSKADKEIITTNGSRAINLDQRPALNMVLADALAACCGEHHGDRARTGGSDRHLFRILSGVA
jgi:hypothetical protein